MTSEEDFRRPAPPPPWLSFSVCPATFHDHDPLNTHNAPYNTFLCRALS